MINANENGQRKWNRLQSKRPTELELPNKKSTELEFE